MKKISSILIILCFLMRPFGFALDINVTADNTNLAAPSRDDAEIVGLQQSDMWRISNALELLLMSSARGASKKRTVGKNEPADLNVLMKNINEFRQAIPVHFSDNITPLSTLKGWHVIRCKISDRENGLRVYYATFSTVTRDDFGGFPLTVYTEAQYAANKNDIIKAASPDDLGLIPAGDTGKIKRSGPPLIVGIPREIKEGATRVGLTPAGVRFLTSRGVRVIVESGAGQYYASDIDYKNAGAEIIMTPEELWGTADIIKKVKEPQPSEFKHLRSDLIVFTYQHLGSGELKNLTKQMVDNKVTAIGYETIVTEEDGHTVTPSLKPMSIVAGHIAGCETIIYTLHGKVTGKGNDRKIELSKKGHEMRQELKQKYPDMDMFKDTLKGKNKKAVIIGGGVVGEHMARVLLEAGAQVTVMDIRGRVLEELAVKFRRYGDSFKTIHSMSYDLDNASKELLNAYKEADILGGATYESGKETVKMGRELLKNISSPPSGRPKVIADPPIDQGGNWYNSRSASHAEPVFIDEFGNIRYSVPNIPDGVGSVASPELEKSNTAYTFALAFGLAQAVKIFPELGLAINTHDGHVTHPTVAQSYPELPYSSAADLFETPAEEILDMEQAARDVGRQITMPVRNSTLFMAYDAFKNNTEYEEEKNTEYSGVFHIERIGTDKPEDIVNNIISRVAAISGERDISGKDIIVQLPDEFSRDEYKGHLKNLKTKIQGVKFVIIDTKGMNGENRDQRKTYRRAMYSYMSIIRSLDKELTDEVKMKMRRLLKVLLDPMIKDFSGKDRFLEEYIEAFIDDNASFIIKTVLSYKPPIEFDARKNYENVVDILLSA